MTVRPLSARRYSIYISGYFPYTFLAFIIPAMLLIVLCLLVLIGIMVSTVAPPLSETSIA